MKKLLLIGLVLLCGCGYMPKSEEIKTEVQTEKETEIKTEKKTELKTEKRTERKTEKRTERKTEKQTEKRTEKPTEQKTEKQTEQKKPTESSGGHLTRAGGVFYFNGYKETWYSTNEGCGQATARPIPGKYVDENGIIRDEDGYICVASSDLPFYSVITISLGDAKVYDTGCSHGTIDVYTTW